MHIRLAQNEQFNSLIQILNGFSWYVQVRAVGSGYLVGMEFILSIHAHARSHQGEPSARNILQPFTHQAKPEDFA